MSLLLSLSNRVCKLVQRDFPRLLDAAGQNPGVQSIVTNSTQVSWQCQIVQLTGRQWQPYDTGDWVLIWVEAYSRYTMMKIYPLRPEWEQIEADLQQLWLEQVLNWLSLGGFVRYQQHSDQVRAQFNQYLAQGSQQVRRNLDPSIGGNLADHQQWLWSFLHDERPKYLGDHEIRVLCEHLNQLPKRVRWQGAKKHRIYPVERFLDDSLYRFAKGLCDQPIQGCAKGDFPNPHG